MAFKPLPSNHQWIKKTFLYYLNFYGWLKKLFLRAVIWTTFFNYMLIIVCIYTCIL